MMIDRCIPVYTITKRNVLSVLPKTKSIHQVRDPLASVDYSTDEFFFREWRSGENKLLKSYY